MLWINFDRSIVDMKSNNKVGSTYPTSHRTSLFNVTIRNIVLYACGRPIDISLQVYFIYHKTNAALLKDIK